SCVPRRAVVVVAVGASFIGASFMVMAPAARADCSLATPSCVIDTVEEVVDPATEITDPVLEEVTEVTDPVVGTIGGLVDNVEETVGPIIDEVEAPVPGPSVEIIEPPSPGDRSVDPPAERLDVGRSSSVGRTVPVPALAGSRFVPNLELSSTDEARIGPTAPAERSGLSLEDVVKGLTFPLALALIVGAFLLAQDRIDRRDPRLALAPLGPDILPFT
ncbi:MAG: hypothetical protein ACRDO9_12780, partial [Gaiellales bacterium]